MWTPRSVTQLARSDLAWRALTDSHVRLYRLSRGRIGGRVRGVDILLLDHVGRRSGKRRTTPLLYIEDGENLVIVASKGGSPKHPAWWVNLRANPETAVQVGGERRRIRAREAEGSERERLWPRVVEAWPDYENYQRRTERRIPVVVLEPAG
jgi:deazaflavin-dependent oxidoreductase (nitroreductase family)